MIYKKIFLTQNLYISKLLILFLVIYQCLALSIWQTEYINYITRYQQINAGWHCGSGEIILNIGGIWSSLFAGNSLHHISHCCLLHDEGYAQCIDKPQSDYELQQCLSSACNKDDYLCNFLVADLFSNIVVYFGFVAYTNSCGYSNLSYIWKL